MALREDQVRLLTEEQREAYEKGIAQYGDLFVRSKGGRVFMVRPATLDEAARYQDGLSKLANPKAPDNVFRANQRTLAKAATIYPTGEDKDALFTSFPLIHTTIAEACVELSGGGVDELGND